MEGYSEYRKWMDARARKDLSSAKILLDSSTSDIGNIIFLLEQSYEKILKLAYVYSQTRVFGKDFDDTVDSVTHHEDAIKKILTILPELLRGFNTSVNTLKDRLNFARASGDMGLDGLVFVMIVFPMIPTPKIRNALVKQMNKVSNSVDIKLPKNRKIDSYQEWVSLCRAIRQKEISLVEIENKFEEAYSKYNLRINAAFRNPDKFKLKIREATMFIALATNLAPLCLAYKYARYPTKNSNFKNLVELDGHSESMKEGLYVIYEIVSQLLKNSESFNELLGDYVLSDKSNQRWKRKMEKKDSVFRKAY